MSLLPSDHELVERAVRNARPKMPEGSVLITSAAMPKAPRWVAIKQAFALGSTLSKALCTRYGLDPDEGIESAP